MILEYFKFLKFFFPTTLNQLWIWRTRLWSWNVSSVSVWVTQLRKLLLHLLQRRWSEDSGVSSMFPLLQHAQVNGFKSDRIAGLLVDFLPNRVGVFPLSLLCFLFKLKHEEDTPTPAASGHTNKTDNTESRSRCFFTSILHVTLIAARCSITVPTWLQICWCQTTELIYVNKCYLNHRGEPKSLNLASPLCLCVMLLRASRVLQSEQREAKNRHCHK